MIAPSWYSKCNFQRDAWPCIWIFLKRHSKTPHFQRRKTVRLHTRPAVFVNKLWSCFTWIMNWNWREWSLESSAVHYSVACGLLAISKVIPTDTDDSQAIFLRINIFTLLLDFWRTVTQQLSAVLEWIIVAMIDPNARNASLPNAHSNLAWTSPVQLPALWSFRKCLTISRIHDCKVNKNYALCWARYAVHFKTWFELLWQLLPQTESLEIKTNQTERKNKQNANRSTIIQMIAIQFSRRCRQVASS